MSGKVIHKPKRIRVISGAGKNTRKVPDNGNKKKKETVSKIEDSIANKEVEVINHSDGPTQINPPIIVFGESKQEFVTANVGIGVTDMSQFIEQFSTLLVTHPFAAKDFLQRVDLRFRKNNNVRTLYQLTENDKTELVSLIISFCTKATDSGQPVKIKDFNVVLTDLKKSGKTLAEALISVLDSTFTELKSHLM